MTDGIYICEYDDRMSPGRFVVSLKETEKSYIMKLIENTVRYTPAYFEMLFGESGKTIVKKKHSPHAMCLWSDTDFTIYPFRGGVPFYFRLDKTNEK